MATLEKVKLNISVVLGSASMPVHQVLRRGRGAVVELDAGENDEVRILANDCPVAIGSGVVSGNLSAFVMAGHSRSKNGVASLASAGRSALLICDTQRQTRMARDKPGHDGDGVRGCRNRALVPPDPICYMLRRHLMPGAQAPGFSPPHAVVAELVDALA